MINAARGPEKGYSDQLSKNIGLKTKLLPSLDNKLHSAQKPCTGISEVANYFLEGIHVPPPHNGVCALCGFVYGVCV